MGKNNYETDYNSKEYFADMSKEKAAMYLCRNKENAKKLIKLISEIKNIGLTEFRDLLLIKD